MQIDMGSRHEQYVSSMQPSAMPLYAGLWWVSEHTSHGHGPPTWLMMNERSRKRCKRGHGEAGVASSVQFICRMLVSAYDWKAQEASAGIKMQPECG